MAVLSDYLSGTITVTKGSTVFTGTGTAWRVAGFREGDTVQLQGFTAVIAGTSAVDPLIKSNNTGNFTEPWAGSSGTFAYRMRYLPDGARVTAQTRALIDKLGNGNIDAFAGLNSVADKVPFFSGTGTMDVSTLTAFARTLLAADSASAAYGVLGEVPDARISETLPQSKSYRRGNVIGAVSQSGGVPTGYLMQRGSNANGEFARYADGTLECWSNVIDLTYVNGLVIRGVWTYPSAFVSPPALTPTMFSPYFYNGTAYTPDQLMAGGGCLLMQRYDSAASATVDITRPTVGAWAAGDTLRGKFTAIGRWF